MNETFSFTIGSPAGEYIKLEILEVYGFPDRTSFHGGYDILCRLEIRSGVYGAVTNGYYSCTGAIYKFYTALEKCHAALCGKCGYSVPFAAENELDFTAEFDGGAVTIRGEYIDDPHVENALKFEFPTDQSYLSSTLAELKAIVNMFGDNKGKPRD